MQEEKDVTVIIVGDQENAAQRGSSIRDFQRRGIKVNSISWATIYNKKAVTSVSSGYISFFVEGGTNVVERRRKIKETNIR